MKIQPSYYPQRNEQSSRQSGNFGKGNIDQSIGEDQLSNGIDPQRHHGCK